MPLYRVVKPVHLPIPDAMPGLSRLYEPGEIVLYTGTPSRALEPLDEAARVAKAAAERSYELLPNGVQTRDRRTGSMRNVRFGGA